MPVPEGHTRQFQRVATTAALGAGLIGSAALVAAAMGRDLPTRLPTALPMRPPAAAGIVLICACIVFTALGATRRRGVRIAVDAAGASVAALGLLSMVAHFIGTTGGIFGATRPIGAFNLLIAGAATVSLQRDRTRPVGVLLGVGVALLGTLASLSFVYGGEFLDFSPPVSEAAALAVTLLGTGLIAAAGPDAWPARAMLGPSVQAMLLRWMLPLIAVIVVGTDVLTNKLFSGFSPAIGSVFNTVLSLAIAAAVLWYVGGIIARRLDLLNRDVRESEARFRRLFSSVPAAISVTRRDDGRFLDVNEEFLRMSGYRREELIGRTASELRMWGHVGTARADMLTSVASGETRDRPARLTVAAGRTVDLRLSVSELEMSGEKVLIAAGVDETERLRAEEALRVSERRIASMFRESPVAMTLSDVETGHLIEANGAFLRLIGATSFEQVLGKTTVDLGIIDPDDRRRLLIEPFQAGRRFGLVCPGRKLSGEPNVVEVSLADYEIEGRRVMLASLVEITDRLRVEAERREAERQYRELVDGVRDVVFALSPDLRVTSLNPAFERMTGFPAGDWVGKPFADLLHPDDVARAAEELSASIAGRARDDDPPVRIRTAKGDYRFGEVNTAPRFVDGRLVGIFGIGRDVSDRMKLEDDLRQAQKMDAVGRLAGGIAHDFNNLLTVIIGVGHFLLERTGRVAEERVDIEEIVKAGERAADLTRQLLAFSRRQVMEPRDLDVNAALANMDRLLRRLIGADVKLVTQPAPQLGNVRADAGQLEQVLANLAVNARDAMPGGGTLTMSTAGVVLDDEFVRGHPGARAGPHVKLSVADTGTGMTPDVKGRIFEPFFTTKGVGKGTGLGLPTVYGIVRQSGGFIDLDTEPGKGTRFDIYLPVTEPRRDKRTRGTGAATSLEGTETILVVDDTDGVRDLSLKVLRSLGYTVLDAASGEKAIELAASHAGPIDLLVTDVVLPGLSGRTVADRITGTRPGTRVLYCSGYTDDVIDRHGVLEAGVTLLQKPFTKATLGAKVREVLDAPVRPPGLSPLPGPPQA